MEYKKKSLANLDIKKDYEEIDTRLASGWYVDDINISKKKIYKTKKTSFKISKKFVFPDHHNYTNEDLEKLKKIALNDQLEIITTEKDYNRLTYNNKKNIKYLKVELQIENYKKFSNFLKEKI